MIGSPIERSRQAWRLTRVVDIVPAADDRMPTADWTADARADAGIDDTRIPRLDDDGLLRHRGRWVAVPDAQLPIVRLLLERFQTTVADDDLLAAYVQNVRTAGGRALAGALHRLGRRVGECGLTLRRVRARGYILDHADAPVSFPSDNRA